MRIRELVLTLMVLASTVTAKPVKVFILAGQSNMEGKAKVELLNYQATQPATADTFKHLRKGDQWVKRDDVWIKFLDRKGKLTIGYGSPKCIGPELEFGHVVGERFEEPVLLIKTAWGGRSLWRDFRPPSAGLPADASLEKMLADLRKQKGKEQSTIEDVKKPFGASYRAMLEEVDATLKDLKTLFPQYDGGGYELAGFIWFQGWNDMINDEYTAEYTSNLGHFIRDVRRDLKSPELPFVVAQMGVDGANASAKTTKFKDAQAAIVEAKLPKVEVVRTDVYWDTAAEAVYKKGWRENLAEWNTVGSDYPYHYLGSPRTMLGIGHACAEAVIRLMGR